MMRRPNVTIALSLAVALGISLGSITSGSAETVAPSPSSSASPEFVWPDESKPIQSYCQPEMFACEGYQPLSDEQYLPPWTPGFRNYQGYYHNDLAGLYRFSSYALAISRDSSGQATSVIGCKDIAASDCRGNEISIAAVLPMCSAAVAIDCLRDITITDANNKALTYTVEGQFPLGNPQNFQGSPAMKVPNGEAPTLIHIPDAPHKGGDTYLIKAEMKINKWDGQADLELRSFIVSISAVKIIEGKFSYGGVSTNPKLYTKGFSEIGGEEQTYPSYCAAGSKTQCAQRFALPLGLRFGLTVDLSRKINGWLHGRVKSPVVSVTTNKAGGSTITVSAEPIKIPVNATWVNNDKAAKSIKDFYAGKANYGSPIFGNENKTKPLSEIALLRDGNQGHNQETLNEYLAWLDTLGDKAQALPTAWVVQTMSNYQVADQVQKCLNQTDQLAGIVTTNAAEYLDGPPVFDKKSGSLDYKVAATHYEPDGTTVFRGTYDLVMSSKVARCIYGFTNAPISATVSITSDSGANNVATTVVGERNGWLSLGAYNFSYSSPTISVVLTGTPEAPAVTTPTKAPTKPVAKKITCVKGKTAKVLSASKCPKGYTQRK